MARVTVEDCLKNVPNRFALVLLVTKRAKQLAKGAEMTVATKGNKNIVASLREVAIGNVNFDYAADLGTPDEQIMRDLNK